MLFYIFKTSLASLNFQRAASTWTFVDKISNNNSLFACLGNFKCSFPSANCSFALGKAREMGV